MDVRHRHRILSLALMGAAACASQAAAQARPDSLPTGVTAKQVEDGKKLFLGAGLCMACHGMEAKGGIGPDQTSGPWLHGRGTYQELMDRVKAGVPLEESKSGQMMPPGGGGGLNEAQLHAVAAYVWTVSRRKTPER
jgi:mono/diheme cytochrome c family protein